ncbi:TniQ family protein [Pseudomonas syringae pv. syringae]|uniref:TniQ family protein n=1 Tax=Pseudomonas syringae TaxID=317 RepID=UPI00200B8C51|nr:TniQ family protein [Pseudomonas syringae]MCK9712325.1 TniQ family protein [Pseudomonas syringae pv. syringae]
MASRRQDSPNPQNPRDLKQTQHPQNAHIPKERQASKGLLVFILGPPRAGASAVAKELARVAKSKGVNCLAVGEAPWGGNVYLRTHILRSLEVPLLHGEFQNGDLVSKPYEALLALRSYPAIIIDDGHDYFVNHPHTSMSNLSTFLQLTEPPIPRTVFVFGISNVLAPIALAAEERGAQIVQLYLPAMAYDERYQQFVQRVLARQIQRHASECSSNAVLPAIVLHAVHTLTKGSVGRTVDVISDIAYGSPWVSSLLAPGELYAERLQEERATPALIAPTRGAGDDVAGRTAVSQGPNPGKAFAGMVKPIDGESLSSWLSRNATSPHVPHVHSEFLNTCAAIAKAHAGGDLDRLYEHEAFLQLFPESDRHRLVKTFALPPDGCSFETSLKYCPQCLVEDVRAMRAPALRIEWRLRNRCLCERHGRLILLQELTIRSKEHFHRGWLDFSQHASTGSYILGNHFAQRLSSLDDSSPMEQRLCRVVRRVTEWVEASPDFPTYGRPSKHCIQFLMGFFLYRPFERCKGGLGRWFLGTQRNRSVSKTFRVPSLMELDMGVETAAPRELALTYLLVGSAFDLLSRDEIGLANRALYFTNTPFPESVSELATLSRCFLEYNMEQFKRSARRNLPAGDLSHLEWLFPKKPIPKKPRKKGSA